MLTRCTSRSKRLDELRVEGHPFSRSLLDAVACSQLLRRHTATDSDKANLWAFAFIAIFVVTMIVLGMTLNLCGGLLNPHCK